MSPRYTGFPALIYSGLWVLKKIGLLEEYISRKEIVILVKDAPPAFKIIINDGDFSIELLDNINTRKEIEALNPEFYIAIPSNYFLGSTLGIFEGISNEKIQLSDESILILLGKISSVF